MSADAGEPEVVLRLNAITRRFGSLIANDAISLDLRRGEIVALLGENGAGKTTLMNILFGHYVADAGDIEAFGRPLPPGEPRAAIAAGIGMVHQHFTLADNLTVLDNIILGTESLWRLTTDRGRARRRIAELSRAFGLAVDPDATVGALAVGERQRVEILKALYRDARILILDEPTAVLTPQESAALFDTLRRLVGDGLSIIFISHKLYEVMAVSSRVLVLRQGKLVAERETAGTTRQELAELMVGRPVPEPKPEPQAPGAPLLALRRVSVRAPGRHPLIDVDLELRAGQILALAGVSGNGQNTLADLLAGLLPVAAGTLVMGTEDGVRLDSRRAVAAGIGRIPEDRLHQGLVADMSVEENVIAERYHQPAFSRGGFLDWLAARRFAETIIRDYDVKCPHPGAVVRLLSGGNQQKLLLGRVLTAGPSIIVANQPTRGLDIGAIGYVHARLIDARRAGAAVLLISEDLDEIMSLADVIAVAYRGRISPPLARAAVTVRALGELMAGHGFELQAAGKEADAA
jgi:simple sugar transport system ATP-binding protein